MNFFVWLFTFWKPASVRYKFVQICVFVVVCICLTTKLPKPTLPLSITKGGLLCPGNEIIKKHSFPIDTLTKMEQIVRWSRDRFDCNVCSREFHSRKVSFSNDEISIRHLTCWRFIVLRFVIEQTDPYKHGHNWLPRIGDWFSVVSLGPPPSSPHSFHVHSIFLFKQLI